MTASLAQVVAHGGKIVQPRFEVKGVVILGLFTDPTGNGKSTRIGAHKCYQCRKPFTVKIGSIFESSHVALRLWLQAIYLIASSKKGFSANQLHRTLGVTLKTAWFMGHRIREAMREGELAPFGQGGGGVEVDETCIGFDPDHPVQEGQKVRWPPKNTMISLVDRNTGRARSYVVTGWT